MGGAALPGAVGHHGMAGAKRDDYTGDLLLFPGSELDEQEGEDGGGGGTEHAASNKGDESVGGGGGEYGRSVSSSNLIAPPPDAEVYHEWSCGPSGPGSGSGLITRQLVPGGAKLLVCR